MKRYQGHKRQKVVLTAVSTVHLMASISQFATATELHKSARREEKKGFPLTAAMKWRKAAELFNEEFLAESCWREWERIMRLPRTLAGALSI
jgi:hypothetical protein